MGRRSVWTTVWMKTCSCESSEGLSFVYAERLFHSGIITSSSDILRRVQRRCQLRKKWWKVSAEERVGLEELWKREIKAESTEENGEAEWGVGSSRLVVLVFTLHLQAALSCPVGESKGGSLQISKEELGQLQEESCQLPSGSLKGGNSSSMGRGATPCPPPKAEWRTTVYKNSFVPYTTRLWNSLPRDVREAATYNQFRLKCKAQMLTTRRHQKFRRLGDRRSNILSTRLRLDWSQLNSTLVKFNLTPRSCSCGAKSESVAHYLLHCPLHKDARQTLATAVRSVVDQSLSTNMLLNGLPGHNLSTNQNISAALQGYILQTKRF
ncbi:hypothetical protein Bbelb_023950 [Branchiostoma belcheri]|nr:hypothetical protein Bbelb_023950 [Branchiostoma belcheri]